MGARERSQLWAHIHAWAAADATERAAAAQRVEAHVAGLLAQVRAQAAADAVRAYNWLPDREPADQATRWRRSAPRRGDEAKGRGPSRAR